MAELLIKAVDATADDPETDKGCYKRGDVVIIRPDGWEWGQAERPPKFFVLRVPGLSVEDAEELTQLDVDSSLESLPRRRSWHVMLDDMSGEYLRAIESTGRLMLPQVIFDRFRRNKKTQVTKFVQLRG